MFNDGMGVEGLRRLQTRAELVAALGAEDAFARWDPPANLAAGYMLGGAVAYLRRSHSGRSTLSIWGADVEPLVAELARQGVLTELAPGWISLPRNQIHVLDAYVVTRGGGEWDWMWCASSPPIQPEEGRVIELDDVRDADEIARLLLENPRSEGYPGQGRSDLWLGIRDGDFALLACGAIHRLDSGTAHLAGIHTAERARGQGLGRAVTAALTRWAVKREGVCTLGMYADSHPARALYHSLGYRTDKEWTSRALVAYRNPASAYLVPREHL